MAWPRRSIEHPPLRLTRRVGDECTSPRSPRQAACRSPAPRPGSCPDGPARAYLAAPRAALLPHRVPPALLIAARSQGGPRGRGSGRRASAARLAGSPGPGACRGREKRPALPPALSLPAPWIRAGRK